MYLLYGDFGRSWEDSCIVNLVCSNSIEKLNDLKELIEQNVELYFSILSSNEFPKQSELELAEDNYYKNDCDENLKILDDFVTEKFDWRYEQLKKQIPEHILKYLENAVEDDCVNLYIREVEEI